MSEKELLEHLQKVQKQRSRLLEAIEKHKERRPVYEGLGNWSRDNALYDIAEEIKQEMFEDAQRLGVMV